MRRFLLNLETAWRKYLRLPWPVKPGNKSSNNESTSEIPTVLPVIGLVMGLIWFILIIIFKRFTSLAPAWGFILTLYTYFVTKEKTLDGLMNTMDALTIKGGIREKEKALASQKAGPGSIIAVIIILLGTFIFIWNILKGNPQWTYCLSFIAIPAISRGVAGLCLVNYEPLTLGEYYDVLPKNRNRYTAIIVVEIILIEVIIVLISSLAAVDGGTGAIFMSSLFSGIFTLVQIIIGKNNLRGINEDIAGSGIALGEFMGLLCLMIECTIARI